MKATKIVSADNQRLKLIRALGEHGTRKDRTNNDDLFLLEGTKLVEEALKKKITLIDVVVSQTYYESGLNTGLASKLGSIVVVQDKLFKHLYTTDTSCGIIATAKQEHHDLSELIRKAQLLLLGDNIQDPGNLGTIIRTAYAFEADGLILSKGSVDCHSPKVVRSSMGAIFNWPIINRMDLKSIINQLKTHDFHIIALDSKAKKPFWEEVSDKPKAYIFGNEGHGIDPDILSLVDSKISIPINPACESLNVAVATGIMLAQRQLRHPRKS